MSTENRVAWSGPRVFSIAEIGLNHGGSADRALAMVDAAASAGATAVKLQSIVADELVTPQAALAHVGASSLRDYFRTLELDWDAHRAVVVRAHARGLLAMTTPFSVASVPRLAAMGFDALKIASGDLTFIDLVDAVSRTGLPVLLSSGMSTLDEVGSAVAAAQTAGARQLAVLHGVSAYPTPIEDENLRAIATIREACGLPVGLSDHGRGLHSALAAVALGASVYERHFILDGDDGALDRAVSSTPHEFAAIVAAMEETRLALGDGVKACRPAERDNRDASRRGLYAARPLARGHRLTAGDIAVLRPSSALAPGDVGRLVGAALTRPVAAGEAFHEVDAAVASVTAALDVATGGTA
jgi:N,N'-diacetyllegionaminate synthase